MQHSAPRLERMPFQKQGEAFGNTIRVHILKAVGGIRNDEFVGMRYRLLNQFMYLMENMR